jgi:hypothetical protein
MLPFADLRVLLWVACCSGITLTSGGMAADDALRTFVVPRTMAARVNDVDGDSGMAGAVPAQPHAHGRLNGIVGVGYVQHADFGAEALTVGTISGFDVQLDALVAFAGQGAVLEHGTFVVRDSDRGWSGEAGDLYSDLHGPVRGLRWSSGFSKYWQPGVSVHRQRLGGPVGRAVVVYRDRIRAGPIGFDTELASDASQFFRTRVVAGHRVELEASYRRAAPAVPSRDKGIQGQLRLMRGVTLSAGFLRSERAGDASDWRSVAVHLPLHRAVSLTFERTVTASHHLSDRSWAVMAGVRAGSLFYFQRYQWGRADLLEPETLGSFSRENLQSMTSYSPRPRLHFAVQTATQWSLAGRAQHWLELQSSMHVAQGTALQFAMPLSTAVETTRLRARLEQNLPRRFSLVAEYGRPSAFHSVQIGAEQPRFKIMVRRTWDAITPARGGEVRGQVLDYIGRPVPGARVRLGPYATDANASGAFAFTRIPRGDMELSLDPAFLPADYAWDARGVTFPIVPSSRIRADLIVAPLNTIHGRVYLDLNGDDDFDAGEGVSGAVVRVGDAVTATDSNGGYDFYNLPLGAHVVRIDPGGLPARFTAGEVSILTVTLSDGSPVTGADFRVIATARAKPVIWREIK